MQEARAAQKSRLIAYTNFEQIVDRVQRELINGRRYQHHQNTGTLDAYYNQMITSIVTDMVAVPLHRQIADLEPIEDPDELALAFAIIADTMGTAFHKTFNDVQNDLVGTVEKLPVDDIRHAIVLRHDNKLH